MSDDLAIWKNWRPGGRLFVTSEECASPDSDVWTLSPDPSTTGWETDSGCGGYGLPKAVANAISDAYNRQHGRCLSGEEEITHVYRDGSAVVTRTKAGSSEEIFVRHLTAAERAEGVGDLCARPGCAERALGPEAPPGSRLFCEEHGDFRGGKP